VSKNSRLENVLPGTGVNRPGGSPMLTEQSQPMPLGLFSEPFQNGDRRSEQEEMSEGCCKREKLRLRELQAEFRVEARGIEPGANSLRTKPVCAGMRNGQSAQ
jgi:hypothetical protein